jgi:hypothetical protein
VSASKGKTATFSTSDARARLRIAEAYLEVSKFVLDEQEPSAFLTVAAGLAVLAGIAASDTICGLKLGVVHRGESHHEAPELLTRAVPDGKALASALTRLLDVKDASYYGVVTIAKSDAALAVRRATRLVMRAREEAER